MMPSSHSPPAGSEAAGQAAGPAAGGPVLHRVKKFGDQVYEQILEHIVGGTLPEGERLPSETALAEQFGVSRPVVREALARLRADGVVVSRHGSGSYVQRRPTSDFLRLAPIGGIADVMRAYEYRLALEGEAAWLAAERRTEKDLRQLAAALRAMEQACRHERLGAEADLRFHRAVAAATKNQLFEFSMESLSAYIGEGVVLTRGLSLAKGQARLRRVQQEHIRIFDAIREHDCAGARQAMRLHIDNARRRLLGEEPLPEQD